MGYFRKILIVFLVSSNLSDDFSILPYFDRF